MSLDPAAALDALAELIADRVAERLASRVPPPTAPAPPYTVATAAARLNIPEKAVRKLVDQGRLAKVPTGERRVLITFASVERMAEGKA